ncbi:tetratricopeptide repeat protein [Candidatus Bipolaricaulota bacterium]
MEMRQQFGKTRDLTEDIARQASEVIRCSRELFGTYALRGRLDDVLRLTEALDRLIGPDLSEIERVRLLLLKARVAEKEARRSTKGHDELIESLNELVVRATKLGSVELRAEALYLLSAAVMGRSELGADASYDEAQGISEESLELRRELGDPRGIAESLFRLGILYQHKADDAETNADTALTLLREACSLAKEAGDRETEAHAMCHIGWVLLRAKGDHRQALAVFEESLQIAREIGWEWFLPPILEAVGVSHYESGDLDKARMYFEETERLAEDAGFERYRFSSPVRIGELLKMKEDIDGARREYERAIEIAKSFGFNAGIEAIQMRIADLEAEGS